jgi:hypothetical protein
LSVGAYYKASRIQFNHTFMAKTLRAGLSGYKFMGWAHGKTWPEALRTFNLRARAETNRAQCKVSVCNLQGAEPSKVSNERLVPDLVPVAGSAAVSVLARITLKLGGGKQQQSGASPLRRKAPLPLCAL